MPSTTFCNKIRPFNYMLCVEGIMAEEPEQGMLWPPTEASKPLGRLKVVGIDENGLGPRLGPLVVTGFAMEAGEGGYDRSAAHAAYDRMADLGIRIGDSKEVAGFKDMAGAEDLTLALMRLLTGRVPATADEFLGWISLAPFETLCPSPSRAPCFAAEAALPLFSAREGFAGRIERIADLLSSCAGSGSGRIISLKSNIYCSLRYNDYFARFPLARKSLLNFAAFEEVIRHFTESFGEEALYLCGKVMNLKFYTKYFEFLSSFAVLSKEETHLVSEYSLRGLGQVRFIHDGDRLDMPISMASIAGKYVREVYVSRINAHFAGFHPDLKPASGYNDGVTKALIDRVKPDLKDLSVMQSCFLRLK